MLAKLAWWATLLWATSLSAKLTVLGKPITQQTQLKCSPISAVRSTGRDPVDVHLGLYTDDRFITAVFCHLVKFLQTKVRKTQRTTSGGLILRHKLDKSDERRCVELHTAPLVARMLQCVPMFALVLQPCCYMILEKQIIWLRFWQSQVDCVHLQL